MSSVRLGRPSRMDLSPDAARRILAENRYLTLATADEGGQPWASPVWFAVESPRQVLWASKPGTRHSQNVARRPEVAFVVYDSSRPPGEAAALYVAAVAAEVSDDEVELAAASFSAASVEQGLAVWGPERFRAPARLRLYRATVTEAFLHTDEDEREPVEL
jgi:nitroimidazol reductase NimA-like FMN-containing flavoprotein (pyridoxamine 5'-phosphate oxidase superfamily)